ncbi:hypothetical protein KY290_027655 [Solanum tuberosum]|uniref:Uncharacterized protein n=1 Tax=Solanum tuberosum TaxID=4113 RepID=A0ABQ7UGX3_SOLTU|nr:hypothetical protein KY290_027655 [Solanum tuberosum]
MQAISRRPTGERKISKPNIHDWVRIGGYERSVIEKTTRKQSAPSIDMPPPRYWQTKMAALFGCPRLLLGANPKYDILLGVFKEKTAEKIGTLANGKVESYSPSLVEKKNVGELIMNVASTSSVAAAAPATGKDAAATSVADFLDAQSFPQKGILGYQHLFHIQSKATFLGAYKGGINNLEELQCLEHLKLLNDVVYMNKIVQLPVTFFRLVRTIKKLTLGNTRFAWSEAAKLGKLEFLEVLKLKENAFMGDTWKPEVGGFSKLQVLWNERAELETWETLNHNFPILGQLVLVSCDKLNYVPFELADIPNLYEMRLENTIKAVKSAKDIVEHKMISQNIKFKFRENLDVELAGSQGSSDK